MDVHRNVLAEDKMFNCWHWEGGKCLIVDMGTNEYAENKDEIA